MHDIRTIKNNMDATTRDIDAIMGDMSAFISRMVAQKWPGWPQGTKVWGWIKIFYTSKINLENDHFPFDRKCIL